MKFVGKNGAAYRKLCQKHIKLALYLEELVTVTGIEVELAKEMCKNEKLEKDTLSLKQCCEDLLKAEILSKENLSKAEGRVEELKTENQNLHKYIENLGQNLEFQNSGKVIVDVGGRHQRRKLTELKTKVGQALWFAKTFGLDVVNVNFIDANGLQHSLSYCSKERKAYKDLSEEEQQNVKNILFILDKFCIGDAAYHELTMAVPNIALPRSYLIKQCKEDLNKICHITKTPGPAQGAQVDFDCELQNVLQKMIEQNLINQDDPALTIRVKISGDGAQMSRVTSFVVVSFSILNNQAGIMSSKGNHTLAIIKGQESYELLKQSCSTLFQRINTLIEKKTVKVNGRDFPVEVYLGGDYKFLLLMLGMKSATSDFACIWCKVHKKDRHDTSKPKDFYWCNLGRTIDEIKDNASKNKFSCKHQPLVNIRLENVVLDELHLMLRVTDKLIKNLVTQAIEWDRKENLKKAPINRTNKHVDDLVGAIRSCGITFNIWEKRDANGQGSNLYDFTSLMGADKNHLLEMLPSKIGAVIRPDTSECVVKLWKDFCELYGLLRVQEPTSDQILHYFDKASKWVRLFTSLGGKAAGYEKARVTPYMHAMVYHAPTFMEKHKGIKQFTGQGVEKLNDDCRRIHLQRSNKWDAAKDVLLVGKRMERLSDCERKSRKYEKQKLIYWDDTIKDSRSKRHRLCMQVSEDEPSVLETDDNIDVDISTLSCKEIKLKLGEMGIKTKLRSKQKLEELLKHTLSSINKENIS